MKTTIKEEWKNIKGYEGLYQASTLGNIRSMNYRGNGGIKNLKTTQDRKGYLCVSLYKNGNKKVYRVHRLIAETFIKNPNNREKVSLEVCGII